MNDLSVLETIAALGLIGLGVGAGLALGAFAVATLRRYLKRNDDDDE